jgi:NADPH-dependent 2,4-dienoyl-CoA reductase/sulfur reductase-like enzyme
MILHEHEKNGAKVYTNIDMTKVKLVGDKEGKLCKVVLESGYEVPADLLIVGAGISPNT